MRHNWMLRDRMDPDEVDALRRTPEGQARWKAVCVEVYNEIGPDVFTGYGISPDEWEPMRP